MQQSKPIIGITIGDINSISAEIILKVLQDNNIFTICQPLVIGSQKVLQFYKKLLPEITNNIFLVREIDKLNASQINVFNCWEEDVLIEPGKITATGGKYAAMALERSVQLLKNNKIHAVVTCPIDKSNIKTEKFPFVGHTPFFKQYFGAKDVVMFMVADNLKVALVTEHIPIKDVVENISVEKIINKTEIIIKSLQQDFNIIKPKIAVLGLNPHAGDEGVIGKEEQHIIKPAIANLQNKGYSVFGPYSADAFFARGHYTKFDAVLAMYHDQGLIPFKSLAMGEGINFTAGISAVRTSPDHGTAFDIAGKNKADESSLRQAIFKAVDIINNRQEYQQNQANPLKKVSNMITNTKDE